MAYAQTIAQLAAKQETQLIAKLAKMYGFDAEEAQRRIMPKSAEQREEERTEREANKAQKAQKDAQKQVELSAKKSAMAEKIATAQAELTQLGYSEELPTKMGDIKKAISTIKKQQRDAAKLAKQQEKEAAKLAKEQEKEAAKAEKEAAKLAKQEKSPKNRGRKAVAPEGFDAQTHGKEWADMTPKERAAWKRTAKKALTESETEAESQESDTEAHEKEMVDQWVVRL